MRKSKLTENRGFTAYKSRKNVVKGLYKLKNKWYTIRVKTDVS